MCWLSADVLLGESWLNICLLLMSWSSAVVSGLV